MSFGDWFARVDKPIYPANADGTGFAWRRWLRTEVVSWMVIGPAYVGLGLIVGWAWSAILIGLGSLAGLTWYCIWRRRRNRAKTGSPTTWPAEDFQP